MPARPPPCGTLLIELVFLSVRRTGSLSTRAPPPPSPPAAECRHGPHPARHRGQPRGQPRSQAPLRRHPGRFEGLIQSRRPVDPRRHTSARNGFLLKRVPDATSTSDALGVLKTPLLEDPPRGGALPRRSKGPCYVVMGTSKIFGGERCLSVRGTPLTTTYT